MKEYKFIQMKYSILNGYISTNKKYKKLGHREIINDMAEQGWSFVGQLPVDIIGGYSYAYKYDLVFEKEE